MAVGEGVVVAGLEIEAELSVPPGPEHEIQRGFSGDGVAGAAVGGDMRPLRAQAEHELHRVG